MGGRVCERRRGLGETGARWGLTPAKSSRDEGDKAVAMRVTRDVALLMRKKRRACSGEIGAAYVSLAPHLQGRARHLHERAGTRACAALQTPVDAKTCRTECLSTERAACSGAPCSVAAPTDQSGMVDRSFRSC